jgi:hypothetical protein
VSSRLATVRALGEVSRICVSVEAAGAAPCVFGFQVWCVPCRPFEFPQVYRRSSLASPSSFHIGPRCELIVKSALFEDGPDRETVNPLRKHTCASFSNITRVLDKVLDCAIPKFPCSCRRSPLPVTGQSNLFSFTRQSNGSQLPRKEAPVYSSEVSTWPVSNGSLNGFTHRRNLDEAPE